MLRRKIYGILAIVCTAIWTILTLISIGVLDVNANSTGALFGLWLGLPFITLALSIMQYESDRQNEINNPKDKPE